MVLLGWIRVLFILLLVSKATIASLPAPGALQSSSPIKKSTSAAQQPLECPTTFQTASNQIQRLFLPDDPNDKETMTRNERVIRITVGWLLLLLSKSILLSASMYLKLIVEKTATSNRMKERSVQQGITSSTFGLFLGVGVSRIISGIVGLVCDLILSPATNSAADVLPKEAFGAALAAASRRFDDGLPNKKDPTLSAVPQGQEESRTGSARRALDRGVKASGTFLYRVIFNLVPKFVDSTCVLVLLAMKTGIAVGLVAGVVAYVYAIVTSIIMQKRIPLLRRQLREQSIANGYVEDALSLAETVAAFGANREEENRYEVALKSVGHAGVAVRRSFAVLKCVQMCIIGLGSTAVALTTWYANPQLTGPALSSQLAFVQSLYAQLCVPLDTFGIHFRDAASAAEDLRELEELKFRMSPFLADSDQTEAKRRASMLPKMARQGGGRTKWKDMPPRVIVKNLYYTYPPATNSSKYALKNISMEVPAGGYSIGVVGPSGSGKSTLFRVLLGLEPMDSTTYNRGSIILDGVDVTYCDRSPCFCLVGQENDLFRSLTLVNNIRYGTTLSHIGAAASGSSAFMHREHEALIVSSRDAQLHHLISRIQGGWEAAVGPRGRLLSGGERARVCLARALYREELCGGLLLLDECTASLDPKTEALVVRALHGRVEKGATAILIAHRLSSVQRCDKIYVMKDGQIAQSGSHSELIQAGGWYAESWKVQRQQK